MSSTDPERWQAVKDLFDAALARQPEERARFLDRACAGDEALRREVESLLASDEEAKSFMETPAVAGAAESFIETRAHLSVGQQISHYQIASAVGAGGMGEVYLAKDISLGRNVAIKILPEHFTAVADRLRRFKKEAQTASALNHPNIITIYEIARHEHTHFIAMEFIDGVTLRQTLANGPLSLSDALDVGTQVATALTAAHEAKIIHRDIKPENIMVRRDRIVKVLDFGLAKLTETTPPSLDSATPTKALATEPGRVMGTISYMSPEQARGLGVDARTDIWSLGVVLYEMVTGRAPFNGETTSHIAVAILEKEPASLVSLVPNVPLELQRIVHKTLAKDPDERYQTARDLLIDLKRLKQELEFAAKQDNLISGLKRRPKAIAIALVCVGLLVVVVLQYWLRSPVVPKILGYTQLTHDGQPKYGFIFTDGARLYFGENLNTGLYVLTQVSVAGGETAPIPISLPLDNTFAEDIAANKNELLLVNHDQQVAGYEGSVWILPVGGGSPRRVGDLKASSAVWSPDGQQIVYSHGSDVYLAKTDGTGSRKLLTAPSPFPGSFSWSPHKQLLSFTSPEAGPYFGSLWETSADGSNLHQLLPAWKNKTSQECCGRWTPDGRYYLFISQQQPPAGRSDIWAIREQNGFFWRGGSEAVQLTNGPLSFESVAPSTDGKKLFARGSLFRGELMRYDAKAGHFVNYLSGISAEGVDFSRDGAWVTYVAYPEGTLWRSRADGSERLQLSFPPMQVFMPRWSPDGKRIAFNAKLPGKPGKDESRIYLISADGGNPEQLLVEERGQGDLSWSPKGNLAVFAHTNSKEEIEINLLDLRTMEVSTLPGSQGLYSPRWSPDGHYVAALSGNFKKLMLYDFTTSKWAELALANGGFGYPSWSHDGKYIYAQNYGSPGTEPGIIRVRLNDRDIEQTIALKDFTLVSGVMGQWSGLAPDDSVMVLHDIGSQELYALDWLAP